MTPEDWKKMDEKLCAPYGSVKLLIDGYHVSYAVEQVSKLKFGIMTYVGGAFKGKWLTDNTPEAQKFMRTATQKRYRMSGPVTKKDKRYYKKELGIDLDQRIEYHTPFWKSFKSLKSHLVKHNKSIEFSGEAGS